MRQQDIVRQIEEEARIEQDYFGPDFDELFGDYQMSEAEAHALSSTAPRNKPKIPVKSLPTRRRAA